MDARTATLPVVEGTPTGNGGAPSESSTPAVDSDPSTTSLDPYRVPPDVGRRWTDVATLFVPLDLSTVESVIAAVSADIRARGFEPVARAEGDDAERLVLGYYVLVEA